MLPKTHRIHTDQDIKELVQTGKTFFLPQLTIKYAPNNDGVTKVGFIVSSKVDKKAVVRHRLTRRMREASRRLLDDIRPGYSLLIIAKKAAIELSFEDLSKQLIFAFSQMKIYNKK